MSSASPQISTREFIERTRDDLLNKNTSTEASFFSSRRLPQFKHTIDSLDTCIDLDRDNLSKMKKALKAMSANMNVQVECETQLSKVLEKLGASSISREEELEIGQAFIRFSIVTSELTGLMRTLMHNLTTRVMLPLESMLKNDLKGINGDLKRSNAKSLMDFESRLAKIEKDQRKKKEKPHDKSAAKEIGQSVPSINPAIGGQQVKATNYSSDQPSSIEFESVADTTGSSNISTHPGTSTSVVDKEKRAFQLTLCDFLLRVNEIRTRKGVDLLQHLVEHFNAQAIFFREGLKTIEHYQSYVGDLSQRLSEIKVEQDDERKSLIELRSTIKASAPYLDGVVGGSSSGKDKVDSSSSAALPVGGSAGITEGQHPTSTTVEKDRRDSTIHGYNLHQLQGNLSYGFNKSGYLLKKSEGKMRVKAWHKRRCEVVDGFLCIYHSDESKAPTKLNLLTCQVKPVASGEEKRCFDLISYNRTYHFQAEDDADLTAWVSVLINCKEGALKKQFDSSKIQNSGDQVHVEVTPGGTAKLVPFSSSRLQMLRQSIIARVQAIPGNEHCVDCGTTQSEPTWLSINLGVLTCIECSGIHRDLGVQVSRIQSLTLDNLGTSQLIIAMNLGNDMFNDIFEAKLESDGGSIVKLKPSSTMDQRCEFIKTKYVQRKFCAKSHQTQSEQLESLQQAVITRDLKLLLQLFAEGVDLASHLPNFMNEHTQSSASMSSNKTDIRSQGRLGDSSGTPPKQAQLNDTSLHLAVSSQAVSQFDYHPSEMNVSTPKCVLPVMDFIIQNSRTLNRQNRTGETALHYCVKFNKPESMKLLLRSGADISIKNSAGLTPMEMAKSTPGLEYVVELLNQAAHGKKALFEHVNIEWGPSISATNESSCEESSDEDEQRLSMRHNYGDAMSGKKYIDTVSKQRQAQRKIADEIAAIHAHSAEKKKANFSRFRSFESPSSPVSNSPISTSPACTNSCDENESAFSSHRQHPRSTRPDIDASHNRTPSDPAIKRFFVDSATSCSPRCDNSTPSPNRPPGSSCSSTTQIGDTATRRAVRRTSTPPSQPPPSATMAAHVITSTLSNLSSQKDSPDEEISKVSSGSSMNGSRQGSFYNKAPKGRLSLPTSNSDHPLAGAPLSKIGSQVRGLPVPPPRKRAPNEGASVSKPIKAKALFPCKPDRDDELGFEDGEIIQITSQNTADHDWWEGHILGQPERQGVFPAIFVKILRD
ncbi:ArfGAP with SH3 domain, ANK repeat and PH domain-containing protein [Fragariocoptes setiger]|uniref:ArfGAP with SH3 domain, ANK repeat and PH domain-containing protein n=1 Tax=Fragariocoptes setiger TaxID=1670756 RepID=A0ABQ7S7T5_9ACAR|nr:ArfGAP with SH3 domain, ANK repeat and PH domain-containing protein [Fragariocoptes setiger]